MQHSGRHEVKDCLLAADHERMSRVVPAVEADDDVGSLCEQIDDLALPFVAPLGADHDEAFRVVKHRGHN